MDGPRIIIEQFIADVCAGKVNQTPGAYRSKLKRFAVWMSDSNLTLDKLSAGDVSLFIRSMQGRKEKRCGARMVKGGLSPFTIHTTLRTLKHFLRWMYARGTLPCDLSGFKLPPLPSPDPKAADPKNILAMFHAAARLGEYWEQARNLALLYVLRDTGGRIGAILSADIDNLDLAAGKLYVREKGDKPQVLYLNSSTIEILGEWLRVRPLLHPKCHHLFINCRGCKLKLSGVYSLFNRLIDAAGLRGKGRVNPHAWRHAFARDSLSAGEDLSKVSQTMGHSTIRVTADYYARWADGELKEAHSRYSPGSKLAIIRPRDSNLK